jgi:hypothetical protein
MSEGKGFVETLGVVAASLEVCHLGLHAVIGIIGELSDEVQSLALFVRDISSVRSEVHDK